MSFTKLKIAFACAGVAAAVLSSSRPAFAQDPTAPLGDPLRLGQGTTQPGSATAPTQPGGPQGPDQPEVMSPYWQGDGQGNRGQGSGQDSNLPAADIRAVAPAHAAAVAAKWTYRRAERDLTRMFIDLDRAFEQSDDFTQAAQAERDAWDAFKQARTKALEALSNDPVYQANEKLRTQLTEQIKDLQASPTPDMERVVAMSSLKLDYGAPNRKMEQAALAQDDGVKNARQNYAQAAAKLRDLRQRHDREVASNQDVRAIQRNIEDLRIARLVTDAYFQSTLQARRIAVEYAYDYRGIDRYRPVYSPYGYGGYGGGYGGGFGYGTSIGGTGGSFGTGVYYR